MGKKLAIKGHPTRGKEVIELFKMMGGCECGYCGGGTGFYYYISQFGNIEGSSEPYEFDTYIVYTLEEFLEKFPYKVGDKVYIHIQNDDIDGRYDIEVAEITSMRWNPVRCKIAYKMKDINREFYKEEIKCKVDDELVYCERFKNLMDNSGKPSVKNHKMGPKSKLPLKYYEDKLEEIQSKRDIDKSEFMIKHMILPNKIDDKLEYKIIDGYEFEKVENNKIILKPIKPKYPTTYEECWKVRFEVDDETTLEEFHNVSGYYSGPLGALQKLLCCRDAYWKIAGEEMGLDGHWEPDWSSFSEGSYPTITKCNGMIVKTSIYTHDCPFAFPSAEMRDAFYENFKDLFEQCKELL